jgi:serine/threonine-protein kinase
VFDEAAARVPSARGQFLEEACGGDAALRAEVEALLAHDRDDGFLEPIGSVRDGAPPQESAADPIIGLRVGHYEITRRIGQGGMGNVYLGVRTEDYTTQVAIKLIRRGMDSETMLARFHHEMQFQAALGMHPNIAQMLDAGETGPASVYPGLPYYVMEYVDGERIDRWCDRRRLSLRKRLELFRHVCFAVQFAHQHTVIHRDLKPSNILVTDDGRPILIDFGIAKLLDETAEAAAERTLTGMQVLTPEYASPEQVCGERLTTASDVYSLGVVLYELLTGRRPYHVGTRTPLEMAKIVTDFAPVRPSDAVVGQGTAAAQGDADTLAPEQVAQARNSAPARLRRALRGDLDRIVLMAMHKDPTRRYGSAEQLSSDIDRHLRGLPVLAHKDSLAYRCKKFVRRNRVPVALAALMLISLVAGIIGTSLQTIRAAEAERTARREAETAKDVLTFFVLDMIGAADPSVDGHDVTVVELLQKAEARIADRFAERPEIRATLRHVLGQTYGSLGLTREALEQSRRAYALRSELLGPDHRDTLDSMVGLGLALDDAGQLEEAEAMLGDAVRRCQHDYGEADALTLKAQAAWGETLQTLGRYDEAEPLLRRSLEIQTSVLAEDDEQILITMSSLAVCLRVQKKMIDAESVSREFLSRARRVKGTEHPATMSAMSSLGLVLWDQQKWSEALVINQELLEIARRVLPPGHWHTAIYSGNVGDCFVMLERYREAEPLILAAYEGLKSTLGEDRNITERRLDRVYRLYIRMGRLEEAQHFRRESVFTRLRVAGTNESASVTKSLDEYVEFAESHGMFQGRDRFYQDLIQYAETSLTKDNPHRAQYLGNLGWALLQKNRFDLAEPLLLASYEERRVTQGMNHGDVHWLLQSLIDLYSKSGNEDKVAQFRQTLKTVAQE